MYLKSEYPLFRALFIYSAQGNQRSCSTRNIIATFKQAGHCTYTKTFGFSTPKYSKAYFKFFYVLVYGLFCEIFLPQFGKQFSLSLCMAYTAYTATLISSYNHFNKCEVNNIGLNLIVMKLYFFISQPMPLSIFSASLTDCFFSFLLMCSQ